MPAAGCPDRRDAPAPDVSESVLELESVSRVYGSGERAVRAVDGVSLRLVAGEVLVIVGPSGSGKTTLLQLVGGIDRPTSGRVLHCGEDLASLGARELTVLRRRHVGFVFQFFNLVPALTAEENVALVLRLDGAGRRAARSRARALLDRLGLSARRDHLPCELSGGEQQRVGIARALAASPRLIVADEPTGNLDGRTGQAVVRLLLETARESSAAVLLVTHDHRLAHDASRAVQMADGKLRRAEAWQPPATELHEVLA